MKSKRFYWNYQKYNHNLPYFIDGKLRTDHVYRIRAEQLLFRKYFQEYAFLNPIVLDLGCHDGKLLKIITENCPAKLFGIDILKNVVTKAKYAGINASVADIETGIPFKNNSVDIVIAGEIIEHFYDSNFIFQEINRILTNNGALIITFPNICSLRNRIRVLFGKLPKYYNSSAQERWGDHIRLFTVKSMMDLLKSSGFKVNCIVSNGLFGKGLARNTFSKLGDLLIFYAIKIPSKK